MDSRVGPKEPPWDSEVSWVKEGTGECLAVDPPHSGAVWHIEALVAGVEEGLEGDCAYE